MLEERLQRLLITKSNGTLGLAKKLSVLKTNNTRVKLRYVEYRKENVNQARIEGPPTFVLLLP